jgi:phosphoglycerol transferase MdoB-like AlkP superfamily enzyme
MKDFHSLNKKIESLSYREIFNLLFLILMPNVIFLGLACYTSTVRPLINIDYLLALLLMFTPWRVSRFTGSAVLVFAVIFDALMFIVQIFPFMDIASIRYLVSFIPIAPLQYKVLIILFLVLILIILWITVQFTKQKNKIYPCFLLLLLAVSSYILSELRVTYASGGGVLGRGNHYVAHSQVSLYKELTQSTLLSLANMTPELAPLDTYQQSVSDQLVQPHSDKILYILAESWGVLRNTDAQRSIVEKIIEQKDNFEFMNYGSIEASGATVAGELRELCQLQLVNNGFALKRIEKEQFKHCIPEQLRQKEYRTVALHGASGLLYDRLDWYPNAGFTQTLFGENFMGLTRCDAFKGVCDRSLIKEVSDYFFKYKDQKIFFYWMSLTSHQPFAVSDIYNKRFDCKYYGIKENGDTCRNTRLESQFMDELAEIVKEPHMKGVEIVVVGDHRPPVWSEEGNLNFFFNKVSYLHFKIK